MTAEQIPDLRRSKRSARRIWNRVFTVCCCVITLIALIPLVSVLWTLISEGGRYFAWSQLIGRTPDSAASIGQFVHGFGNALQGTIVMVGLAALWSVPIGILAAIFISEIAPQARLSIACRFAAKMLTGMPSVIAGIFAFAAIVLTMKHPSAYAGAVALGVLMLPIIVLTAEQALHQVPNKLREAAFGMGATRTQVVTKVVLPTAGSGLLTGVLLAVARAAGETAPLLFTAEFSFYWMQGVLNKATPSMAVFIYSNSGSPDDYLVRFAWIASFVLVVFILGLNIIARTLGRKRS